MIGLVMMVLQQVVLLSLLKIDNHSLFLVLSLFQSVVGSTGHGMAAVSYRAIVMSDSRSRRDRNIGMLEASIGLGYLTGPLLGSTAFQMGGFEMPYILAATFISIFYPFVAYSLISSRRRRKDKKLTQIVQQNLPNGQIDTPTTYDEIKVSELFRIKRFSLGVFSLMLASVSITYIAPVLSIALKMIGFTPDLIGVSFCIPALLYIVTCLITPFITQRLPKRLVIAIGLHLVAGSMFMIGSDGKFLKLNPENFILSGLFVLGFSSAIICTPMSPEQQEAIETQSHLNYDPEDFANFLSSLFIVTTALGETIGPFASSLINQHYGFNTSLECMGVFLFGFAQLYFWSVCGLSIFWTNDPQNGS